MLSFLLFCPARFLPCRAGILKKGWFILAYQVDFGIIEKKINSTSAGFTINFSAACLLKIPCDVYNPTFLVQGEFPPTNNYFHVAAFGRYYWITSIKFQGGQWEVTGETDVLASFKGYIGSQLQYISRCTGYRNGDLNDSLAIANTTPVISRSSYGLGLSTVGCYVICVAGTTGNKFYMLPEASWEAVCAKVFSSGFMVENYNFWQAIQQEFFNLVLDPEDYILNCKWIPVAAQGTPAEVSIGLLTNTGIAGGVVSAGTSVFAATFSFTAPSHPQAATYGTYLNGNAYRKISLALPGYGNIILDADALAVNGAISIVAEMDITGVLTYSINYAGFHTYVCTDLSADAGYSVTKSGMGNAIAAIGGGIANGASAGGLAGAVAGGVSGAISAVFSAMPQVERASTGGSRSALLGGELIVLTTMFYTIADYSSIRIGNPACLTSLPSNFPGYIKCENATVSCPGTEQEIQKINDYLNGGFYYE